MDGLVGCFCSVGQPWNELRHKWRRNGRNDGLERLYRIARPHALDPAAFDQNFGDRSAEPNASAFLLDRIDEGPDQGPRAAVDIAQFLFEQRFSRCTDALDPRPSLPPSGAENLDDSTSRVTAQSAPFQNRRFHERRCGTGVVGRRSPKVMNLL
jgi:hypothetical protein